MAAKSSPGGFVVATVTNPGSFMATITHPTGNGYCRDRILRDRPRGSRIHVYVVCSIYRAPDDLMMRNRLTDKDIADLIASQPRDKIGTSHIRVESRDRYGNANWLSKLTWRWVSGRSITRTAPAHSLMHSTRL